MKRADKPFKVRENRLPEGSSYLLFEAVDHSETLEQLRLQLEHSFPGWFVFRGGSHVALHQDRNDQRLALVY